MDRVNLIAPMTKHDPFLKSRSGIDALYLGLSDSINGKFTAGFNKFHHCEVSNREIHLAGANKAKKWDIQIGEPYVEMGECRTGVHGDDGECLHWPTNFNNVMILLLRIHMYKKHLTHSLYSSILLLICSKSSKYVPARYRLLKICEELSHLYTLTIWNICLSAWMCFTHDFAGCHDWVQS